MTSKTTGWILSSIELVTVTKKIISSIELFFDWKPTKSQLRGISFKLYRIVRHRVLSNTCSSVCKASLGLENLTTLETVPAQT